MKPLIVSCGLGVTAGIVATPSPVIPRSKTPVAFALDHNLDRSLPMKTLILALMLTLTAATGVFVTTYPAAAGGKGGIGGGGERR